MHETPVCEHPRSTWAEKGEREVPYAPLLGWDTHGQSLAVLRLHLITNIA